MAVLTNFEEDELVVNCSCGCDDQLNMKEGLMYMTVEELQLEAFRQIRRKVSDITDESSNDEIAGYVKGIVNLERELYKRIEEDNKPMNSEDIVR